MRYVMHPNVTANHQWLSTLHAIVRSGHQVSPRGQDTLEILSHTSCIDMRRPVVTATQRKLGYRFACAEAAWILEGRDDVASIAPYSQRIAEFSDDGERFFGAYGPKIYEQFDYVVETLVNDPDSRQAVLTTWRENPPPTKDVPCTISLQFLLRYSRLYTVATMRSSDVWLGWPYDVFNFSMVSYAVAISLSRLLQQNVTLGHLLLAAGSQHLYAKDQEGALRCLDDWEAVKFTYESLSPPHTWHDVTELTDHLWTLARRDPPQRPELTELLV